MLQSYREGWYQRVGVRGLYRDGLYPRKKLKKNEEPRYRRIIENEEKGRKIDHFFITLTWDEKLGMKRPLSILPCCRSVDLNASRREIRCSRDENWKKIWPFTGSKKYVKTRWKWQIFHEWAFPWSFSRFEGCVQSQILRLFRIRAQIWAQTLFLACFEGSGFFEKIQIFSFSGPMRIQNRRAQVPPVWNCRYDV